MSMTALEKGKMIHLELENQHLREEIARLHEEVARLRGGTSYITRPRADEGPSPRHAVFITSDPDESPFKSTTSPTSLGPLYEITR